MTSRANARASAWELWSGMWASGLKSLETGMRLIETIEASGEVIDSRVRTIAVAACTPLQGDYRELGRMVPEKMDAFGKAGASAWNDWIAIQSDAIATFQQAGAMALSGRAPSMSDAEALISRSARMMERAMEAGGNALAPLHKRVTANARRLRHR